MQVWVQLFAVLRERAGSDRIQLKLSEGATVATALEQLRRGDGPLARALVETDVVMAVNREYAPDEMPLSEGDELALVPPVSGGSDLVMTRVTGDELSLDALVRLVEVPEAGAIVTFQGVTRAVERLEYEAYVPMAEERIERICAEIADRHEIERIAAEHRVGAVELGRPSVIVAVSAGHRPEAFAAAREAIDRIKAEVPIWKREIDGERATWVEGAVPKPIRERTGER